MGKGRKPKRKDWTGQRETKEEKHGKICVSCHREFWPKTDSDTCLLCQNGLIVNKPIAQNQPSQKQTQKVKESNGEGKRGCLRCDTKFDSDGIYNRICPNCRQSNQNIAAGMGNVSVSEVFINQND